MPAGERPLRQVGVAAGRECLDALIDGVGDEQAAARINREPARRRQLAGPAGRGAERAQVVADGVEHLDALVGGVRDVGVARRIACERAREVQLSGFGADAAPGARERQLRAELDDAIVAVVGDVDVARGVERDAVGKPELLRGPSPAEPACASNAPSGLNFSMRWLSSSETITSLSLAATPRG